MKYSLIKYEKHYRTTKVLRGRNFRKTVAIILLGTTVFKILTCCSDRSLSHLGQNQKIPNFHVNEGKQVSSVPGECELFEKRHPLWANASKIKNILPQFSTIYKNRPFKFNSGGMLFDHSFFLFYTLRSLDPKPSMIVESGAHRGHTTWLIKQTLPDVHLISISPEQPKVHRNGVEYLNAENFTDFNNINWADRKFSKESAFVLLDDHQDNFRRIFQEGYHFGFRRFMIDDNWSYLGGDCLSLRWVCQVKRKQQWPGSIRDNFNRSSRRQTWEEHVEQGKFMKSHTKYYYEFPPLFRNNLRKSRRSIYQSTEEVETISHLLDSNVKEFQRNVLITYVETI